MSSSRRSSRCARTRFFTPRSESTGGRGLKVADKTETLKMFVDGRWVDSEGGETFEARSPATGELSAQRPKGTRADASHAVEAAHRARAAMAGLGAFERAPLLHRIADVMEHRR